MHQSEIAEAKAWLGVLLFVVLLVAVAMVLMTALPASAGEHGTEQHPISKINTTANPQRAIRITHGQSDRDLAGSGFQYERLMDTH